MTDEQCTRYNTRLGKHPGIEIMPEAPWTLFTTSDPSIERPEQWLRQIFYQGLAAIALTTPKGGQTDHMSPDRIFILVAAATLEIGKDPDPK